MYNFATTHPASLMIQSGSGYSSVCHPNICIFVLFLIIVGILIVKLS